MSNDSRCHACLLSRAVLACELTATSPEKTSSILQESTQLLDFLLTTKKSHPAVASAFYRFVHRSIGCDDPFSSFKLQSNEIASTIVRRYADHFSTWGFRELVTAAVIGNSFDYGAKEYDVPDDFDSFFEE
jgi:uncharacterized protein with ATP-grasp and redox domains